jgi:hypothetical protein
LGLLGRSKRAQNVEARFDVRGLNLESSIADRLRETAKMAGTATALCERAGIPLRTFNGWLAGKKIPVTGLVAIANAAGVSIEWLATGRQEARHPPATEKAKEPAAVAYPFGRIDVEYLAGVIEAIESIVEARGVKLTPEKKAEIIALAYEEIPRPGSEGRSRGADAERIARLIRLAR